ncbi:holo-ACP synthase / triphosphoribosyl-dephospho-CoA synthase [Austwickia chelonae]|uniref:Triphosphoribosyl-dephospho-CoA synthase n=1 Tax=Austwickia chelonae NBRC 105200 TaxID=1184607 RepID=K6VPF8_9MICO|nr:triphosphoribosyl-dephospho-CoA synthase [Austwickia chelonae]GAB78599.1 triphosphoribosyl-dephospho-CoA synthase [Austwickia chelonae NBRC 105200]SEW34032.1 holo-ACP synthase / triphosphoribosyl-dephospho-CoA synthase [Austwickia chelonae]
MTAARPAEEVDLAEMLAARDSRAAAQSRLLAAAASVAGVDARRAGTGGDGSASASCVLSLSVVVPGPVKELPWVRPVFDEAVRVVEETCAEQGWPVHDVAGSTGARTGPEALWAVLAPGPQVKEVVSALEDHHPVGRLWDLDVVVARSDSGSPGTGPGDRPGIVPFPLSRADRGLPLRRCLVCGCAAAGCARSRRHGLPQVLAAARRVVGRWQVTRGGQLTPAAALAHDCLLAEVHHTPKPGLVDLRNTGAHQDMDVPLFEASAAALAPGLARCERIGVEQARRGEELPAALPRLREAGLWAEEQMAAATGGVNTHRGAIFAFGLLCAAVGWSVAAGRPVTVDAVCALVAATAEPTLADVAGGVPLTHGLVARAEHGMLGARGEAAGGFATVRGYALPAYARVLRSCGDPAAAAGQALLELMARNEDTNLVARGGPGAVDLVRARARGLLADGGVWAVGYEAAMWALDDELIAAGLSPGGVADLLGVTLFLARLDEVAPGRPGGSSR